MSSKLGFYTALYLDRIGVGRSDFSVIPAVLSSHAETRPLRIYFWTPVVTAGANVIVHDVLPDLLVLVQALGLPWTIGAGENLPEGEVDYLVCFKAIPHNHVSGKHIMLICDQAEVFWSELKQFSGIVATSSQPFASLVARKNRKTSFIGESETSRYLQVGRENLVIPPSKRGNVLIWHGGRYSQDALLKLRPVLEVFAQRHAAELLVVSGSDPARTEAWGNLQVHFMPWSRENLFKSAGRARLGIIPSRGSLRSSYLKPASRVRCLYALGVPTIGDSRVPDVRDFMSSFNGPVAECSEQWLAEMERHWLGNDLDRLAQDGWGAVNDRYSTPVTARQWVNYFREYAP